MIFFHCLYVSFSCNGFASLYLYNLCKDNPCLIGIYLVATDSSYFVHSYCRRGLTTGNVGTSEQTVDEENFQEDSEDDDDRPLVRIRSRRFRGRTTEPAETVQRADSLHSSPQPHVQIGHPHNGGFPSEEVFCSHHASSELWSLQIIVSSTHSVVLISLKSGVVFLLKSMMKLLCLRLQCLVGFLKEHHIHFPSQPVAGRLAIPE